MDMNAEVEIQKLAANFFGEFDNRGDRRPRAKILYSMFGQGATAIKLAPDAPQIMDAAAFIEPRVNLLSSGSLTEFHEWEVEGRTFFMGNIAARCSIYGKEGLQDGARYTGSGRKTMNLYRIDGRWLISSLLWEDD